MNPKFRTSIVAILILALIVATILALVSAPAHPLTWLLVVLLILLPTINQKLVSVRRVEWKPEYSVGIDSIDAQHKTLIELINKLQNAVDFATGRDFELAALDELVNYTLTHFRYEEDLMKKHGYPSFEAHRAEHAKMVTRVDRLLEEYRADEDLAMRKALAFVKDWLINHINGTDQQYSDFLIEKGVR